MFLIKKWLGRKRAERISKDVSDFLVAGERVLDVGCGNGYASDILQSKYKINTTLLDVKKNKASPLPVTVFDGRKIPFPDKSFDVVLLLFVLHHSDDIGKLLAEASRVANKKIIIMEDVYVNKFGRVMTILNDLIWNIGSLRQIHFPFNFKSENEWLDYFHSNGLRVVAHKRVRCAFYDIITPHAQFVLTK